MTLSYTHMYTGDDGLTHFRDIVLPERTDAKSYRVTSDIIPATGTFFRMTGGSYQNEYHVTPPRPGRMFVVVLEGGLEIVASDGTERTFRAGDVFLQDDMSGAGHFTRPLGGRPRRTLFVTLGADPRHG